MSKRKETQPTFVDESGKRRPYPIKRVSESFAANELPAVRDRMKWHNYEGRLEIIDRIATGALEDFGADPECPETSEAKTIKADLALLRTRVAEADIKSAVMHAISLGCSIGRLQLFAIKEPWAVGRARQIVSGQQGAKAAARKQSAAAGWHSRFDPWAIKWAGSHSSARGWGKALVADARRELTGLPGDDALLKRFRAVAPPSFFGSS